MLNNMLNIVAHDEEEANRQERLGGRIAGTPAISSAHQDLGGSHISRDRRKIPVPKELYVLLVDFMKTRKMAGHLSIEFRDGAIASVEAVTKKHYK